MSAEVRCWWCGAEAADTQAVSTVDGTGRWLVIEWPDHPQDHEHTATPPRFGEVTEEMISRFLRAIGATE